MKRTYELRLQSGHRRRAHPSVPVSVCNRHCAVEWPWLFGERIYRMLLHRLDERENIKLILLFEPSSWKERRECALICSRMGFSVVRLPVPRMNSTYQHWLLWSSRLLPQFVVQDVSLILWTSAEVLFHRRHRPAWCHSRSSVSSGKTCPSDGWWSLRFRWSSFLHFVAQPRETDRSTWS